MSPIGLGNDIGGSLRNPAYCCGIASIKPSRGRVAQGNPSDVFEMAVNAQIMLAQGVLARHVGDVRRGLEVVMGAHHRDPQSVDVPLDGPPASRRVALVAEPFGGETDPGVAEGVRVAGRALDAAGYEVDEIGAADALRGLRHLVRTDDDQPQGRRPKFEPFMGEDGRRFLDLTTVEFPPATPESMALMFENRYTRGAGLARVLHHLLLDRWTDLDSAALRARFRHHDEESALKVIELFRFVLPGESAGSARGLRANGCDRGLSNRRPGDRRPVSRGPLPERRRSDRGQRRRAHADRSPPLGGATIRPIAIDVPCGQ